MKRKLSIILVISLFISLFANTNTVFAVENGDSKNIIDVTEFGAVGDGKTDDTDAIKKALDYSDGKTVFFPNGTYCITDFSCKLDKIDMRGEDNAIIVKTTSDIEPAITFYNCKDAYIKGITFDAGREQFGTEVDTACIYFRGNTSNVEVSECSFINASREATAFIGNANNIKIHDNKYNNTSALVWSTSGYIEDLIFENNEAHNGRINGVELIAKNGEKSKNIIIKNNKFYDFGGNIIQCRNIDSISIENNYVRNANNFIYIIKSDDDTICKECNITNNSGEVNEIIHCDKSDLDIAFETVTLQNDSFALSTGMKFEAVNRLMLINEHYNLVPEAKITLKNVKSFVANDIIVDSSTNNKAILNLDNVQSLDMDNCIFDSNRAIYAILSQNNMKISMNRVKANFSDANAWWVYYPVIYSDVKECENNSTNNLKSSVENGNIKIPAMDEYFEIVGDDNCVINKISGYSYEGRKVVLRANGIVTFLNGNNIELLDNSKTINKSEEICLSYSKGKWIEIESDNLSIEKQPNNVECNTGDFAKFNVLSNKQNVTYRWYKSIDQGISWTRTFFEGATTSEVCVPTADYMDGYLFRCEISDGKNTIISNSGRLNISAVKILSQPVDCTVNSGEKAIFEVTTNKNNIKYQWYKSIDKGTTWTKTFFEGSTSNKLIVDTQSYMEGYYFKCVITAGKENYIETNTAKIILEQTDIIKQPESIFCKAGDNITFTIETKGCVKSYQWYKSIDNGSTWTKTFFEGCNTSSLKLNVAKYMNGYQFKCVVGGNSRSIESKSASIQFVVPLEITNQPKDCIVNDSEMASFSVNAIGTGVISYCWERSKDNGNTWEVVPYGETRYNSTLEFPVYSFIRPYLIRCKITDTLKNVIYSDIVKIEEVVKIVKQPQTVSAKMGESVSFCLDAEGKNLMYEWEYKRGEKDEWSAIKCYENKLVVVYNETNSDYIYRCKVSDSAGNIIYSDNVIVEPFGTNIINVQKDSDYIYTDDKNSFTELISTDFFINHIRYISAKKNINASISFTSKVDASKDDNLILYFQAKASEKCAKINLKINDSFSGNYPVTVEGSEYYIPFNISDNNLNIELALTTDYQELNISNIRLLNYHNINISKLKTGIFSQNVDITRYSELDKIAGQAISLTTCGEYVYSLNGSKLWIYKKNNNGVTLISSVSGLGQVRLLKIVSDKNLAIVSSRENGVFFIDISNKKSPYIISNYSTLEMATGFDYNNNYLFVCNRYHGIEILDITDLHNPVFCSVIKTGDELYDCCFYNGYLYIGVWGQKMVEIYDVRNIMNPIYTSTILTDGWTAGLDTSDSYLYVSTGGKSRDNALKETDPGFGMGNGLEIYDISNPSKPKWCSTNKVDGKYQDAAFDHWKVNVSGNIAVLCSVFNGIYIFDITNPYVPKRIDHLVVSIPKGDSKYYFKEKENVVYPYNPDEEIWSPVEDIALDDGKLYFSDGKLGMFIYNNKDIHYESYNEAFNFDVDKVQTEIPTSDKYEISKLCDDAYSCYSIQTNDKYLFVACGNQGIKVFDKATLALVNSERLNSSVLDIKLYDDKLYVAASSGGLYIYSIKASQLIYEGQCNIDDSKVTFSQIEYLQKCNYIVAQVAWTAYAFIDVSDVNNPCVKNVILTGSMYYRCISNLGNKDSDYIAIYSSSEFKLYKITELGVEEFHSFNKSIGEIDGISITNNKMIFSINNQSVYLDLDTCIDLDLNNYSLNNVYGLAKFNGKIVNSGELLVETNPVSGEVNIIRSENAGKLVVEESLILEGNPDIAYIDGDNIYIPCRHGGIYILHKR